MPSTALNDGSSGSSMQKVLKTTELLENILSFLSMRQVLGKARVSRSWKSVIDHSPNIQKSLFLRPHSDEIISPAYYMLPGPPDIYSKKSAPPTSTRLPVYHASIQFNPLICEESDIPFPFDIHTGPKQQHHIHSEHPRDHIFVPIVGRYSRAFVRQHFERKSQTTQSKPSWRRMFLTSPPITDIILTVPISVGPQIGSYGQARLTPILHILVRDNAGITLGLVRDEVDKVLGNVAISDERDRAQKLETRTLQVEDFVEEWGKVEHTMFFTTTDTCSIGDHGSRSIDEN